MVNFRTLQQRTALIGVNGRRNAVSTMADDRVFKAVVNDSTTKLERKNAKDTVRTYSPSYQTDVEGNNYNALLGKKIGDEIPGENVHEDMTGYTLKVTGGSDKTGTPMRSDLHGGGVNAVLVGPGVGYKGKRYVGKMERCIVTNMEESDEEEIFEETQFLQIHDKSTSQS